jgi:hypothetical protein
VDKYTAGKIEGMLLAARRHLDHVADHLREVSPPEKLRDHMLKISTAVAELLHLSWEIYAEHPELNPDHEAWETSAERYAEYQRKNKLPPSGN